MEQIDRYVKSVYRHIGGNKEEIEILKNEMRNHLLQIVEELKSEGKAEDESISIAIKRFGKETQIENELLGIFKFVNKKAKKTLIVAVSFLIMTIISFSVSVIGTELSIRQYLARNNKIFNIMGSYNQNNIDNINKNISTVFNKSKRKITDVTMYRVPSGEDVWYKDLKDLKYSYPKDIQYKHKDTFNYIGKQITTEKGIKYNVRIGLVPNAHIPTYIQNLRRVSITCLCCFIISVIAWILVKLDVRVHYRH
ncbi:permease prefix domain 1-containing protein [Clostridium estertheticum]|uniref:permease prefix domain 1-containing protein n=1 Tax=Clostridium estertheticum TaxID=238834 RepID=UPI0013EEB3C5|nr:permease prefix domain 1-containing protein [Clostridium estertheticum]MBZ9606575.1 permease prefix domain 1-containing protein [Clostridium estertheticum]